MSRNRRRSEIEALILECCREGTRALFKGIHLNILVGREGFEPPASWAQARNHRPIYPLKSILLSSRLPTQLVG
jgi:hypothetical protein